MWQRFTENARKVVFYAQEEAQQLSDGDVCTEHMLLGITRLPDCRAVQLLFAVGVESETVRQKALELFAQKRSHRYRDMSLTPMAKYSIDLAVEEARRLNQDHIGSEHLLVGLLRTDESLAQQVLVDLGVDLEKLRLQMAGGSEERTAFRHTFGDRCAACVLLELMIADPTPLLSRLFSALNVDDPSLIGRHLKFQHYHLKATLEELMTIAHAIAFERGDGEATPDHLLLAILRQRDNFATTSLAGIGIDYEFVIQVMGEGDGT